MSKTKTPTSIKDYLKSLSGVKEVVQWIKKEVMNDRSRSYIRKTILFSICVIICQSLVSYGIGKVFSMLYLRNLFGVTISIGSVGAFFLAQKLFERKMAKSREWILGIHWGNMDRRMTELFLEKSPGQHIQENSLAVSSIDKGRWNLLALQGLFFFDAVPAVNQTLVTLILLVSSSIMSSGLMLLTVVLYVCFSMYLNFHVMRVCTPIDKSMRRLNRKRVERMEKAIRVIVSSQEKREVAEMTKWFEADMEKDRNFWLWFIGKSTWRSLVNIVLFLAVIGYGARLVWIGVWEIGFLYPLIAWSTRIIENIWHLGDIEQKINWSLPSVKHMITALSIKPDVVDIVDAVRLTPGKPERIVLTDLSHSYPKKEEKDELDDDEEPNEISLKEEVPHTLKKVSFVIEPGEKVALLGPSGAGKTTLMRLLLRFMDPTMGSITVGGVNLTNVAIDSWRKGIGYIAQNQDVFDGTIRENLTYRLTEDERAGMSDESIWKLMRGLEIDFGERLQDGLETKVGKHGLRLSGGQAQRLMIGAAVIGNPWFMIIDEATSSLDSTTERKVQKGLAKILSGKTSALIVAHRLSTVRNICTKFVVLKPSKDVQNGDSQVEAIGSSFEELYEISPIFRQLADDQEISIAQAQTQTV
jgi:ABC-type multidrug transport system fused ATPase/permease subunit